MAHINMYSYNYIFCNKTFDHGNVFCLNICNIYTLKLDFETLKLVSGLLVLTCLLSVCTQC